MNGRFASEPPMVLRPERMAGHDGEPGFLRRSLRSCPTFTEKGYRRERRDVRTQGLTAPTGSRTGVYYGAVIDVPCPNVQVEVIIGPSSLDSPHDVRFDGLRIDLLDGAERLDLVRRAL